MAIMFPNASRSYDATRHAVRFWGYDSAMEWSFFVTVDADDMGMSEIHECLEDNNAADLSGVECPTAT